MELAALLLQQKNVDEAKALLGGARFGQYYESLYSVQSRRRFL